jgi:hypothetical protein
MDNVAELCFAIVKSLSLLFGKTNMEKITLTIKDESKKLFFLELLKQFDFIEVEKAIHQEESYNFFSSAGMWKGRDISADKLSERAWKRG